MRIKSVRFSFSAAQVTSALSLVSLVAMVVGSFACERFA
jgi:hypothetical protein